MKTVEKTKARDGRGTPLTPTEVDPSVQTATYFEVGRDGGAVQWGERTIPDLEVILIEKGRCFYDVRGKSRIRLRAGDVLVIPPGEWHVFGKAPDSGPTVVGCIHGELARDRSWSAGEYDADPAPEQVTSMGEDRPLRELFRQCAEAMRGRTALHQALADTLFKAIWLRLSERWQGRRPGLTTPSLRVRQMQLYLRTRLADPVSRRDLARVFRLTPEYVNSLFKRELGISPTRYVQKERIRLARRLLREQHLSVKEAAARVGFQDVFFFSRVFKRIEGVPPSRVARNA